MHYLHQHQHRLFQGDYPVQGFSDTIAEIVETAMHIAASLCVYTNDHITIEELQS